MELGCQCANPWIYRIYVVYMRYQIPFGKSEMNWTYEDGLVLQTLLTNRPCHGRTNSETIGEEGNLGSLAARTATTPGAGTLARAHTHARFRVGDREIAVK